MAVMVRAFAPPGAPLLAVKITGGCAGPCSILFVPFLQLSKKRIRRSFTGAAKLLDPFRQHLRVAESPELLKCAARRFPHGIPIACRIDISHDIRDQDASSQGDAQ